MKTKTLAAIKAPLTIDAEFKALIPPLHDGEIEQLEENLKEDGCRDALVFWRHGGRNILLDGHNRLALCTKNNISYRVIEQKLPSRAHARIWILENQFGRRNLTEDQRAITAFRVYEEKAALSRSERAQTAASVRWLKTKAKGDTGKDTLSEVAKKARISAKKLRQLLELDRIDDTFITRIEKGELRIAEARRLVRKAQLLQKLESKEVLAAKRVTGKYDVIVCDPPWPSGEEIMAEDKCPYRRMNVEEIQQLVIDTASNTAAADCHFFLWVNQKFLPMAFVVLEAAGFIYNCTFVWQRSNALPVGSFLPMSNCDFALYARKNHPQFVTIKDLRTCFYAKHTDAGRPKEFYSALLRTTAGRRLNMFETRNIEGFDGWGKA